MTKRPRKDNGAELEFQAKSLLNSDLTSLRGALVEFLNGEVSLGLISPYKMLLLVQARTLLAVVEKAQAELLNTKVRF